MSAIKKLYLILLSLLLLGGLSLVVNSFYIDMKAKLAQELIEYSWRQTKIGKVQAPWPWADTYAIAKLNIGAENLYVLHEANMRNLAFGPTMINRQHQSSGVIILGHRDTHFRRLEDIQVNEVISLQLAQDVTQHYKVAEILVVDIRESDIVLPENALLLVTCYPFDAISADPTLRFVVSALPFAA